MEEATASCEARSAPQSYSTGTVWINWGGDANGVAESYGEAGSSLTGSVSGGRKMERVMMKYWTMGFRQLACVVLLMFMCGVVSARAYRHEYPSPPVGKNVTISNGGLSITFNIAWGGVVVAVANRNVAKGLNIVDTHDVGRELQVDQFLRLMVNGRRSLMINPTQAGALGQQGFYRHPHGIVIPQAGSKVIKWKSGPSHFYAVIDPLDYDTGNPTNWVYVEDVRINSEGVAHFHFTFYDHEPTRYLMDSEVPTLYSDWTDAFLYPIVSPYGRTGKALSRQVARKWPVKMVRAHHWPGGHLRSKGWIANIDTKDNIGIFYTTPVGLLETYGVFPHSAFRGKNPLGKSNVTVDNLTFYPKGIYSIDYSVLVSTPNKGPTLISQQPQAVLKIIRNHPSEVSNKD